MTDAATPSQAEQAIAALRDERTITLRALSGLSDQDLATKIDWRGSPQAVNQRIMGFGTHAIDHEQHLLRLLNARGRGLSAAEYLWVRNATLLAAVEAMCLVLDDDDFTATGPDEGDWSAAQVLEHVTKVERSYRERVVAGLAAAKAEGA